MFHRVSCVISVLGLGLVGWFQGRVSKVSKVRVSVNIALGPGFTIRVSNYVCVLYHTNIALDTHIKFCYMYVSTGLLVKFASQRCCLIAQHAMSTVKADTARWAIQRQSCEAKFEVWHRYGT